MPAGAVTAHATIYDGGTQNCGSNYTGHAVSKTAGYTTNAPPGSGYYTYTGVWTVPVKKYANTTDGGDWAVSTTGDMSDPGTYAGCTLTGS